MVHCKYRGVHCTPQQKNTRTTTELSRRHAVLVISNTFAVRQFRFVINGEIIYTRDVYPNTERSSILFMRTKYEK